MFFWANWPVKVMLMAEEMKEHKNVMIDIPDSLNDPKFERSDREFLTDEYRKEIER